MLIWENYFGVIMKAHESGSKKIYCLECREPITSREDLYVVLKDGANRAIHPHCHRKLDEMGLVNPPIKTIVSSKSKRSHFLIASIFWLLFGTLFGGLAYSGVRGPVSWLFMILLGLIVVLTISMPFVSMVFIKKGIEYQFWIPFERHLPATCRECHEVIPPKHKNCPACGWKYVQPEARLANKVTK